MRADQALPPWLFAPVAREHRPPVRAQAQLLPLGELDPADLERLCVALAREDGEPEACRLYGTRGQAQDGIDLYARLPNGRYVTYQCKRYAVVTDSDIRDAVAMFRTGDWRERSERFVFCTSRAAIRTDHSAEIERQTRTLRADGIAFEVWDAEELSTRLKTRPQIVLDFFGRSWVEEFCTTKLDAPDRLDAREIARLRAQLRDFKRCSPSSPVGLTHLKPATSSTKPPRAAARSRTTLESACASWSARAPRPSPHFAHGSPMLSAEHGSSRLLPPSR